MIIGTKSRASKATQRPARCGKNITRNTPIRGSQYFAKKTRRFVRCYCGGEATTFHNRADRQITAGVATKRTPSKSTHLGSWEFVASLRLLGWRRCRGTSGCRPARPNRLAFSNASRGFNAALAPTASRCSRRSVKLLCPQPRWPLIQQIETGVMANSILSAKIQTARELAVEDKGSAERFERAFAKTVPPKRRSTRKFLSRGDA